MTDTWWALVKMELCVFGRSLTRRGVAWRERRKFHGQMRCLLRRPTSLRRLYEEFFHPAISHEKVFFFFLVKAHSHELWSQTSGSQLVGSALSGWYLTDIYWIKTLRIFGIAFINFHPSIHVLVGDQLSNHHQVYLTAYCRLGASYHCFSQLWPAFVWLCCQPLFSASTVLCQVSLSVSLGYPLHGYFTDVAGLSSENMPKPFPAFFFFLLLWNAYLLVMVMYYFDNNSQIKKKEIVWQLFLDCHYCSVFS